jgi:hypothetical protein
MMPFVYRHERHGTVQGKQPMERTKRTRRIRWAGVGLVIVALVVVAIWREWPRKRLLLQHAVKVASIDGWDGANRDYLWASDHEAMLYSRPGFNPDNQVRMISHDTLSGVEKPLSGLVDRLGDWQDKYNRYWLSPDGKWMLYSNHDYGTISATPRDDSRRLTWYSKIWDPKFNNPNSTPSDYIGFNHIRWLPDSEQWIQPVFERANNFATRIVIRSINSPKSVRSVAIPKSCQPLFEYRNEIWLDEPMAWLSETHLVLQTAGVVPGWESTDHSVKFYDLDLASMVPPRQWTVNLPKEWGIVQVVLSPHADHVAWVFHRQYVSPLLTELHRFGLPIHLTPIEETMV